MKKVSVLTWVEPYHFSNIPSILVFTDHEKAEREYLNKVISFREKSKPDYEDDCPDGDYKLKQWGSRGFVLLEKAELDRKI